MTLVATASPTTFEEATGWGRDLDQLPPAAVAIWAFVDACEAVSAGVKPFDCPGGCDGDGCETCGGVGFLASPEWSRVIAAALEVATGVVVPVPVRPGPDEA
jgi:hypothetical protein